MPSARKCSHLPVQHSRSLCTASYSGLELMLHEAVAAPPRRRAFLSQPHAVLCCPCCWKRWWRPHARKKTSTVKSNAKNDPHWIDVVAIWVYTITFLQLFCMSEICLKMLGVKVILRKKNLCTKMFLAAFIIKQQGKKKPFKCIKQKKFLKKTTVHP